MRTLQGIVVSDKMNKTRVVSIERLKKHARYEKFYRVTTKLKAHDESNATHLGDLVTISETRPLSREKRWKILSVIKKQAKD